jgi:hypothetical protein
MNPVVKNALLVLDALAGWRGETFAVDGNLLLSATGLTVEEINDSVEYLKSKRAVDTLDFIGSHPFRFGQVSITGLGYFLRHELRGVAGGTDVHASPAPLLTNTPASAVGGGEKTRPDDIVPALPRQSHDEVKCLRMFLASPGDLQDERRAGRTVVDEVNRVVSELDWLVQLLGWEDTLPGAQRAQELINVDVRRCHLFVGMLWKRWGSHTGKFTSGFAEEYAIARELNGLQGPGLPEIWLFFKQIPQADRDAPDEQLRQVTAFQESIMQARQPFAKQFSSTDDWTRLMRECMLRYILSKERQLASAAGEGAGRRAAIDRLSARR